MGQCAAGEESLLLVAPDHLEEFRVVSPPISMQSSNHSLPSKASNFSSPICGIGRGRRSPGGFGVIGA
jgi:hypothetical protein